MSKAQPTLTSSGGCTPIELFILLIKLLIEMFLLGKPGAPIGLAPSATAGRPAPTQADDTDL